LASFSDIFDTTEIAPDSLGPQGELAREDILTTIDFFTKHQG
jgi:hypothetical protein